MHHSSAPLDEVADAAAVADAVADAADRLDQRTAVIVSLLALAGVTIIGILVILSETVL